MLKNIIDRLNQKDGSGKQSTQRRIAAPCTVPHNNAYTPT